MNNVEFHVVIPPVSVCARFVLAVKQILIFPTTKIGYIGCRFWFLLARFNDKYKYKYLLLVILANYMTSSSEKIGIANYKYLYDKINDNAGV